MYVLMDHYDSFVHNIVALMQSMGKEVMFYQRDEVDEHVMEKLRELEDSGVLEGVVIGPGPSSPATLFEEHKGAFWVQYIASILGRVPVLGICLGHQMLAYWYGGKIVQGSYPMHGKVRNMYHIQEGLFVGIPSPCEVTRYHSLVVDRQTLPACFRVLAWDKQGVILAIAHRDSPIYGVQYHPEALFCEYGREVLRNFYEICRMWREQNIACKHT